ncbi:hypothetical protein RBB78_18805 [Tunturiibacter empetritectus]|uniref:hypothetical protein n=1 Tax=Tunturiibacter empetritectus TaxID=3069691 RepID=UPI003D9AE415
METTKSEGAAPAASNGGASPVLQPTVVTEKASADKTLRIDVDVLNRMMNLVGEPGVDPQPDAAERDGGGELS